MPYIERSLERKFSKMNGIFKVLMVTGTRQVGKTTMLRHLAEGTNRTYVSLDDPLIRSLAAQDPALFFQTYQPPVLVDEVQYAPELFPYIKILADEAQTPGMFWLTGSQHYAVMKNVQESLAGRIALMELLPLSQSEIAGKAAIGPPDFSLESWRAREKEMPCQSAAEVFGSIWQGGMPGVQGADAETRRVFFESYVNSYLLRDVSELGSVKRMQDFRSFLIAASALNGQQLNYATLAESSGISQPTAKEWIQLLEGLGIVWLLRPFTSNKLKRLVRTPKLYFCDTGLASYLAGWPSALSLQNGPSSGAFFENYVVIELLKQYTYGPVAAELSYYRSRDGKEIDLVIDSERVLHPVEIKKSASPDLRETGKFAVLDGADHPRGEGGIVCLARNVMPATHADTIIPAGLI